MVGSTHRIDRLENALAQARFQMSKEAAA